MTTVLEKLLAKTGKSRADLMKNRGGLGSVFRRAGVSDSAELRRILDIPRRNWEVGMGGRFGTVYELVELLTATYRTPEGQQTLWPVQAVALAELHDFGGLMGPIRTSGGKTLISFLAPAAAEAKNALLLVPSLIYDITLRKRDALREHWQIPEFSVQTYEFLSREQNKDWLHELHPDMIIADEAQKLKNKTAACTKRVHWFMSDFPETIFVPLSGTPFNRSLHEIEHLAKWALPKTCPIPRDYGTLAEWALCLDEEKVSGNALAPGKLVKLLNDEELLEFAKEPLRATRKAFQRRFTETPGVVSVSDPGIQIPLIIRGHDIKIDSPEVDHAFREVRTFWRTPDGRPFAEAVKVWAHCRQLACGFYYLWEPTPPKKWLKRRSAWYKDLRHILTYNQRRLATEFQVVKAISQGLYDVESYHRWVEIRDTYKYVKVPKWVHDETIIFAAEWLAKHDDGICWVEHEAFAERLVEVTGLPYYGSRGLNDRGELIEDAYGPIIASVRANGVGRDLQHKWSKNLVVSCAPNGETWEQLLARTHRFGQKKPEVVVDLVLACAEQYFGFQQAIYDAEFASTMLKQPRKLLAADMQIPAPEDVARRKGARWNKGKVVR